MQKPQLEIWTIGHSTRSSEEFIDLLQANHIELLADVRRFPGSRRHPQFGQARLAADLGRVGIDYAHFPELGGRRPVKVDSHNTAWRNEAFRGYADYMETPEFATGVENLLAMAAQKRGAIMCAEALWWQCHRSLIADYLKAEGYAVWHILGPGKVQPHPFTAAAQVVDDKLTYNQSASELELPLN